MSQQSDGVAPMLDDREPTATPTHAIHSSDESDCDTADDAAMTKLDSNANNSNVASGAASNYATFTRRSKEAPPDNSGYGTYTRPPKMRDSMTKSMGDAQLTAELTTRSDGTSSPGMSSVTTHLHAGFGRGTRSLREAIAKANEREQRVKENRERAQSERNERIEKIRQEIERREASHWQMLQSQRALLNSKRQTEDEHRRMVRERRQRMMEEEQERRANRLKDLTEREERLKQQNRSRSANPRLVAFGTALHPTGASTAAPEPVKKASSVLAINKRPPRTASCDRHALIIRHSCCDRRTGEWLSTAGGGVDRAPFLSARTRSAPPSARRAPQFAAARRSIGSNGVAMTTGKRGMRSAASSHSNATIRSRSTKSLLPDKKPPAKPEAVSARPTRKTIATKPVPVEAPELGSEKAPAIPKNMSRSVASVRDLEDKPTEVDLEYQKRLQAQKQAYRDKMNKARYETAASGSEGDVMTTPRPIRAGPRIVAPPTTVEESKGSDHEESISPRSDASAEGGASSTGVSSGTDSDAKDTVPSSGSRPLSPVDTVLANEDPPTDEPDEMPAADTPATVPADSLLPPVPEGVSATPKNVDSPKTVRAKGEVRRAAEEARREAELELAEKAAAVKEEARRLADEKKAATASKVSNIMARVRQQNGSVTNLNDVGQMSVSSGDLALAAPATPNPLERTTDLSASLYFTPAATGSRPESPSLNGSEATPDNDSTLFATPSTPKITPSLSGSAGVTPAMARARELLERNRRAHQKLEAPRLEGGSDGLTSSSSSGHSSNNVSQQPSPQHNTSQLNGDTIANGDIDSDEADDSSRHVTSSNGNAVLESSEPLDDSMADMPSQGGKPAVTFASQPLFADPT